MQRESANPPRDPSRDHYPNTILVVDAPGRAALEIDLREPPAPGLAMVLADHGLSGPFGVITACNPFGEKVDDELNRVRTALLAEYLDRAGLASVPVAGRSPDRSHMEPGFGVMVGVERACAIAREFRQTAIFWWDGECFWIVGAWGDGERREWVRLPV